MYHNMFPTKKWFDENEPGSGTEKLKILHCFYDMYRILNEEVPLALENPSGPEAIRYGVCRVCFTDT